MDSMIERAAKASYEVYRTRVPANPPWDQLGPIGTALAMDMARASIEAMEEPTEVMVKTITDNCLAWECFIEPEDNDEYSEWQVPDVYRAMIRAALQLEKEG